MTTKHVRLPRLQDGMMYPKTSKGRMYGIPTIKRRFKNALQLVKNVPVNELFTSIIENSPYAGNVLDRNWARKNQVLRKVEPVPEQVLEDD